MKKGLIIISLSLIILHVNGQQTDISETVDFILKTKSVDFENKIEEEIVRYQLTGFFENLKDIKGERKWVLFVNDYESTNSIAVSASHIYNKTLYQLAGEIAYKLDKKMPSDDFSEYLDKDIGEFNIRVQKGTKAENDMKYIEYLIELYVEKLKFDFFQIPDSKMNYQANIENIIDEKIKIYFSTNRTAIENQFGKVNGLAAALIGHEHVSDDSLRINSRILFKYYELYTLSALVHELTHMVWAYSYIDSKYTDCLPIVYSDSLQNELVTMFLPFSDNSPLKEGIAEYMNEQHNLLAKYGLFDDVDMVLNDNFSRTAKGFDLVELSDRMYKINDDSPTYEIAHSLFRFIANNFGFEKALELTYSSQTEKDYKDILGVDFNKINTDWNKYVAEFQ